MARNKGNYIAHDRDELEGLLEGTERELEYGALYFVQAGRDGPVKIGRARNPQSRIAQIQSHNPETLRVIAIIPHEGWQEPLFHKAFDSGWIRGEWYAPDQELFAAIKFLVEDRTTDWLDYAPRLVE